MVNAGHEEIGVSVVIVIAHGHAAIEAAAGQSRRLGDIGKHAIAIVAKQPVAVLGIVLLQRGQIGAVGEKDVGTPVAIIVEHGHAASHGGGHMTRGDFAVLELEWDGLQFEPDRGSRHDRGARQPDHGGQQEQRRTHQDRRNRAARTHIDQNSNPHGGGA